MVGSKDAGVALVMSFVISSRVKPDGELGRDLRDGEARGLRGQRRAAGNAGVHLDDDHPAVVGIDAELDVRTARVHADLADDLERGVAHELVFLVRQRLGRRDRDAVSGMDAHGVEVLDGADDDHVVLRVAHHLELVLLPARRPTPRSAPGAPGLLRGRA